MRVTERELPLFPLGQVVLFPGMVLPLHVFEERYRAMIGTCQVTDGLFGVLLIRSGREVGGPAETEKVGCTARISRLDRLPDGRMYLLATGESRFRLLDPTILRPEGYLVGRSGIVDEEDVADVPATLVEQVALRLRRYREALTRLRSDQGRAEPEEPAPNVAEMDPAALSFHAAGVLYVHTRERQALLELDDTARRLRRISRILKRELETLEVLTKVPPHNPMIGPFSRN
jgi:Lon protease-like protein